MDTTLHTVLHGTWMPSPSDETSWFMIWGEKQFPQTIEKRRGRAPKILPHPYALPRQTLQELVPGLAEFLALDAPDAILGGEAVLDLPAIGKTPMPSHRIAAMPEGKPKLSAYQVDAVYLSGLDAVKLLSAIPLTATDLPCEIGTDMRFWSTVAKFALHLVVGQKFIPMLRQVEGDRFIALWEPTLEDSADVTHLDKLSRTMPDACRSVKSALINLPRQANRKKHKSEFSLAPAHPKSLLSHFLEKGVDGWVRHHAEQLVMPSDKVSRKWLTALVEADGAFEAGQLKTEVETLCQSLTEWRDAGKSAPGEFSVCFRLEPPEDEAETEPWTLRYFLQAVDDLSLLVPVDLVWRERKSTLRYLNREFESPQEKLLVGLGIAARMFSPIETSLRQAKPDSCPLTLPEAYQFLSEASLLFQQSGFGVIAPPWWTEKRSPVRTKMAVSSPPAAERAGRFSLDAIVEYNFKLALGDEEMTPQELEQLAKLKMPLVKMRGQWVMLRPEDIEGAMAFFEKYSQPQEMSVRDLLRLELTDTPDFDGLSVEAIESDGWLSELVGNLKGGKLKRLRQPKAFSGALRPYQARGLSWLGFMREWGLGACLADDMGLGKTIQVIAFLLREQKSRGGQSRPNLLICPTSVVGNWQREVDKFGPSLDVMVHHGSDRHSGEAFTEMTSTHDLVVTSYGLAQRDVEDLSAVEWKGVVLDEAQNIKNPAAKTTQAIHRLKAEFRFALTGTPVENRLTELWSIMAFLNPGYLGSQTAFRKRFVLPIERYADEQATKELKSIVAPFILRRLKTDKKVISDLPEKLEMKVYCHLTREQVTLYEAVVTELMESFEAAEKTEAMSDMQRRGNALAGLMKLKQLCNHPALFLHDHTALDGRSGKLQRLVEMLEEALAEGDRALVFTQFSEMGEMLQTHLANKFWGEVLFLHGGVPQKKRDAMVSLFQEEKGPPLFIISLRAGGTGLNLTRANHVFHFDRWWNPAVEDQATDRAFRIGQKQNVQVHKFICAGTLEEQIDQLIERKKTLAEGVIGAGEDWLTELKTDELRDIVTLRRDKALFSEET